MNLAGTEPKSNSDMGDSDKKESESVTAPEPGESSTQDDVQPAPQSRLDVARRFLQTDEVRQASRGEKEIFLAIKGLNETEIEALLDEDADAVASGSSETVSVHVCFAVCNALEGRI